MACDWTCENLDLDKVKPSGPEGRDGLCHWFLHHTGGLLCRQFNDVHEFFLRPTLVAVVTKIWEFEHKTGYNLACKEI